MMSRLLSLWLNTATEWILSSGLTLVAIAFGAVLVAWAGAAAARRAIAKMVTHNGHLSSDEQTQRIQTLQRVAAGVIKVLACIVAALVILSEVGVNIGPILATAGVAGVALGFGAQYLVNDVITGFFILIENQYSVGDTICLNQDICGTVEAITLRMTRLRDLDGVVHHVPNSEISVASNTSKHFSRINLDVGVGYESDLDEVIDIINQVGEELAQDPEWADQINQPPQFLRVEEFGDSAIYMKILGEVSPSEQWDTTGELRKRLKVAFAEAGISMPFPQRTIHQADKS